VGDGGGRHRGDGIDWAAAGWERLAPGAGRCRLPGLDCTAGLVAGPGAALLIDTGATLAEGTRLRSEAVGLLGGRARVTHIALTHPHFDHVLGTAVFADAEVYGAAGLGALLAAERASLQADAVHHGVALEDAAGAVQRLVPPGREVDGTYPLDLGGGVRVLLANVGPGHTAHDLAVLVPGTRDTPAVVFCGDLVEESGEPQAGPDAHPARWPAALDRLLALGGAHARYVPGHGATVDAEFVRRQRDQLAARFGVS
jgi:glyoxylase-like metal-dependent hydrolase (beta-lactamase superfamily II)